MRQLAVSTASSGRPQEKALAKFSRPSEAGGTKRATSKTFVLVEFWGFAVGRFRPHPAKTDWRSCLFGFSKGLERYSRRIAS
jgi:hypothetical protein